MSADVDALPAGMPVPDWLVGTANEVTAAVANTARTWAQAFFLGADLPALNLVDTAGHELLVFSSSDFWPDQPAVRLFATVDFLIRADDVLGPGAHPDFVDAYETLVGETAWGSFDNIMSGRWPDILTRVRRRFEQVLPQLDALAATTVMDHNSRRRSAATVLQRTVDETLTNWDAPETGPLATRIAAALERMRTATDEEVHDRVVASMVAAAAVIRGVRHREWFTPERVRDHLRILTPEEYAALTGLTGGAIASEVYTLDRA